MGKDLTQSTQREEHRERREEEPEQSRGLCRVVEIREGSLHCATTLRSANAASPVGMTTRRRGNPRAKSGVPVPRSGAAVFNWRTASESGPYKGKKKPTS